MTLADRDPELHALLVREETRQADVLTMVAASSIAPADVRECLSSPMVSVTTEGYPGKRFHAGCEVVDGVERLAVDRSKALFGAQYANVQPHSGTSANQIVMFSLLAPHDTILGLDLDAGGHLTHGARASVTGNYFNAVAYGLGEDERIDYASVQRLASEHRPKLIICGASAHPRILDFAAFREIADSVNAYLLADVSHIAGLIVSDLHPSPIDHAHFTTTSTYKQLFGPRGGVIAMGRDHDAPAPSGKGTLSQMVQRACFPYFQGTPNLGAVAAKARAFAAAREPWFKATMERVLLGATALADQLGGLGYRLVTGGTENHIVLVDISARGLTGVIAEKALESCHIIVNKNRIPGDDKSAYITSGIRFGLNTLAYRGMGPDALRDCGQLVHEVLDAVRPTSERAFELPEDLRERVRSRVRELCAAYPMP